MTTTPAMPEPFARAWRNKVTGAKGVYFEDPKPFGITSHPDYEWTNLYVEAQPLAALQAQPAEVSDAEIRHDANLPFVEDEQGAEWVTLSPAMFARAVRRVLALRPQAVPMTDEQAKQFLKQSDLLDMFLHIGWYSAPRKGFDQHALSLIRAVEAHHGITAPAGGEVDRG